MPRKRRFQKYLPTPHELREKKAFRFLGEHLFDPNVWHLNRRSASISGFIGCFFAMMPLPGQTVMAAVFALMARSNLPLAITLVWITNPLTIVPVFYGCYLLGCFVTGTEILIVSIEHTNKEWIMQNIMSQQIWFPLGVGSLISGLLLGLSAYIGISQLWRWSVVRRWEKRKFRVPKSPEQD